jgi:hypothetical protein
LYRVKDSGKPGAGIRTNMLTGWCKVLPKVGQEFQMVSTEVIDSDGDLRWVKTSKVVKVKGGGEFITESGSIYRYVEGIEQ